MFTVKSPPEKMLFFGQCVVIHMQLPYPYAYLCLHAVLCRKHLGWLQDQKYSWAWLEKR